MNIRVNEIFYSIQGESVHAGLPCVFVRLSGCNLRCRYCDTDYAYHEGNAMTPVQILAQVRQFDCNLVEITGGEPLIQEGTPALIAGLLDAGYEVLLETNGSVDIDRADRRCSRIMDIKCPSSGEADSNDTANLDRLTTDDQVKFVIGDHGDFLFAKNMIPHLPACVPPERILFSAVAGRLSPRRLAGWILEASLSVRLQLQLHKVIWPDRNRGV